MKHLLVARGKYFHVKEGGCESVREDEQDEKFSGCSESRTEKEEE